MKTKICTRCGIEKSVTEFNKRKDSKLGCASACKKCHYLLYKNRNDQYKEYQKKYMREYYKKNKEKILTDTENYRKDNKQQLKIAAKKWRKANHEKVIGMQKKYRNANRNKVNALTKKYRDKNKAVLMSKQTLTRKELNDTYVQALVVRTGIPKQIVKTYPLLVKVKRVEIKTKRLIKQISK